MIWWRERESKVVEIKKKFAIKSIFWLLIVVYEEEDDDDDNQINDYFHFFYIMMILVNIYLNYVIYFCS